MNFVLVLPVFFMNYVLVLPAFVIDVVQFVLKRIFYNMTLTSAFKAKLKSRECCTFFWSAEFLQHKIKKIKSCCKNNSNLGFFTTLRTQGGSQKLWERCDVVKITASLIFVQHWADKNNKFADVKDKFVFGHKKIQKNL